MKKVMRLLNVQLWAMLMEMLSIGDFRKKRTKVLQAGLVLFVIVLSSVSFAYAYFLGKSLKAYNSTETLPFLFMAVTSIVVLFTTMYMIKGTVFGFRDYDLVMSLPVSTGKIVASRLMLLYFINLFFVLIIMVPMTAAYGILVKPGFIFYLFGILTVFFIPFIPIIIASIVGTVLAFVSMRFRYSNILYMVFIFMIILAWIVVPFFLQGSGEALAVISKVITGKIKKIYFWADLYTRAVTQADIAALLIFTVVSVLAFLLYSWVVGKIFIKINTQIMTIRHKTDYKMEELKSSSPLMALYKRDIKRYFASPVYVLNTGFGMVILLILTVALPFININELLGEIPVTGTMQEVIPLIIMFCMATSCTTMASVSIEGKNLWIIKSLPVSTYTIFASKILVNLTVLIPAVLASIVIGISFKFPLINGLLILISVISFAVFISLFGLAVNLNFPNLTWSNETVIIKQSMASMISVFFCLGLVAAQFGLLKAIKNFCLSILIFICLVWLFNFILYKRLKTTGTRQFEKL